MDFSAYTDHSFDKATASGSYRDKEAVKGAAESQERYYVKSYLYRCAGGGDDLDTLETEAHEQWSGWMNEIYNAPTFATTIRYTMQTIRRMIARMEGHPLKGST